MFKDKNKILAIINGNERTDDGDKIYVSCDGVSFGGFIFSDRVRISDMLNILKYFCNFILDPPDNFIRFIRIEFQDTTHFDFHQLENIIAGNFTPELWFPGIKTLVDMIDCLIHIIRIFKSFILIDPLVDKFIEEVAEVVITVDVLTTDVD